MKIRSQAQLCLAIYDFEVHSMVSVCLSFQGAIIDKIQLQCDHKTMRFLQWLILIYKLS